MTKATGFFALLTFLALMAWIHYKVNDLAALAAILGCLAALSSIFSAKAKHDTDI
jgi:uncharacterized membrane protein YqjE